MISHSFNSRLVVSVVVSVVPAQPTLWPTPAPKRRLRCGSRRRRERGPERWLRWAIVVAIIMLCHIQRRQGKQQQKTPHAGGGAATSGCNGSGCSGRSIQEPARLPGCLFNDSNGCNGNHFKYQRRGSADFNDRLAPNATRARSALCGF